MSVDVNKVSPPRKNLSYGEMYDAVKESATKEATEKIKSEINLYGGLGNKLLHSTSKDVGYFKGSLEDKKSLWVNIHHTADLSNDNNKRTTIKEDVSLYGDLFTSSYSTKSTNTSNQYLKRYLLLFLMNYAINLKQYEKHVNALMEILKLPEDEISLD